MYDGDDIDAVVLGQCRHQIANSGGAGRVESRSGLVLGAEIGREDGKSSGQQLNAAMASLRDNATSEN